MIRHRSSIPFVSLALVALLLQLAAAPAVIAQGAPAISDAQADCIVRTAYPMLTAVVQPMADVEATRAYFRAAQHPDLYWVNATPGAGVFEAILPIPEVETQQVVFYFEAVSSAFETSRTEEYVAEVVDDESACDGKAAAIYEGDANIVVGSTSPGAASVPPGFEGTGIVGIAGGIPGWVIPTVIIGGGIVGIILLTDDDDSGGPTEPPPPVSPANP